MDRGAWQATADRVAKLDTTEATQHAHVCDYKMLNSQIVEEQSNICSLQCKEKGRREENKINLLYFQYKKTVLKTDLFFEMLTGKKPQMVGKHLEHFSVISLIVMH